MTRDEMKNRISLALKDPNLQQGFEIICKNLAEELVEERIAELEQEKCELLGIIQGKDKVIQDLKEDNAELKEDNKVLKETISKGSSCGDWNDNVHACQMYLRQDELQECIYQLSKAKELLKWALHSDPEHDEDFDQKWEEAEQFLKL